MNNFLQNLARASWNRGARLAAAAALLALAPAARANTITENIVVKGGTVVEQGDEVVITFTAAKIAADGAGTLTFNKGSAIARVLAVGGGGSGGRTTTGTVGGGGGGGAGGMVEASGITFKGGYVISVGKGGESVTATGSNQGNNGDDTTITKNGVQVAGIDVAKGGGGGGGGSTTKTSALGLGKDGGSGGGGSSNAANGAGTSQYERLGGLGVEGQGNAGGKAKQRYIGGGGGGAGAPGTATNGSGVPTPGGDGRTSDITGSDVWYAGGGAGAEEREAQKGGPDNGWIGGKGGGGAGGGGQYTGSRDGEDGKGGGGGGGCFNQASGKGGDGVLIIRLSNYQEGGVVLPSIPDFTYDGTEKTAAVDTPTYTVGGQVKGTLVGTYTMTVTLTPAGEAIGWDDGFEGKTRNVTWRIVKRKIPKPELVSTESKPFTGEEQQGYVEVPDDYTLSAENKGTNAGTYKPTATLKDAANTEWEDGAANPRSDLQWIITPLSVNRPTRTAVKFTYTGNVQTGFTENVSLYLLDDENRQVNAGTHRVTASLKDPVNTKWADNVANPRSDLEWTMDSFEVPKPEAKTGLQFTGAEQTGIDPTEEQQRYFSLTGDKATDVGEHTFVATLNNPPLPGGGVAPNYKWKNGDLNPFPVKWSIAVAKIAWPPAGAKHEYPYRKGVVNTPVPENPLYTIDGTGSAEAAGTYSCKVSLKFNTPEQTNVTWADGTTGDQTWDWAVAAEQVAVPEPKDFVYAEEPKGTAKEWTTLEIADAAPYAQVGGDELTQSQAKVYMLTLALKDPANFVWTNRTTGAVTADNQELIWKISQATNEITNLKLEDWQYGDFEPRVPSCEIKFGSLSDVTYNWSSNQTDWVQWGKGKNPKPTEAGTYYLKASAPAKSNWMATQTIRRFCVWTNPKQVFTDFCDLAFTGAEPGGAITFKLSPAKQSSGVVTGGLPGFEYARAGQQGRELRFVLTNAVETADRLIPYTNVVWDTTGESTLRLQLPEGVGGDVTLRMYWHAADGDPKSDNYPEDVTGAATSPTVTPTLVNREGVWVDYWTKAPGIDKSQWEREAPPEEKNVKLGALKVGSVKPYYLTMPVGTTNETIQTEAGSYQIVFTRAPSTDGKAYSLFGGEKTVAYEVVWHNTYEDFGGTASGRILLGNNDSLPGHEITGQGYWQTDPKYGTYWEHKGEAGAHKLYPYLSDTIEHLLYKTTEGDPVILWRLKNVLMGNHYLKAGTFIKEGISLPWSTTCKGLTSDDVEMSSKEVTHIVLRNMGGLGYEESASIYSMCYENGIGTIYFDAVNGWNNDTDAKIVIEVATQTSKGLLPTDENCALGSDPFYYLSHDADGQILDEANDYWEALNPVVLIKNKGSTEFTEDYTQIFANNRVSLKITTAGTTEAFYRIYLTLNNRKPVRFRIRRPERSGTTAADTSNLILIDNVIVSPPAMEAHLTALGTSDEDHNRTGKQTLGQACALDTAFPAQTDTGVRGRAAITYNTVDGIECDTSKFVASAQMWYRWRYLNQNKPEFKVLYLDHTSLAGVSGEQLLTVLPLDFTGRTGDVEWYYKLSLQAPAYKYVDYSGCGVAEPLAGFIEEIRDVEDHMDRSQSKKPLASGGTDWFVRLRDGHSDWEGWRVHINAADPKDAQAKLMEGTYEMELVDDNMWRAFVVIPTNAAGVCTFSFEGVNRHESPDVVAEANVFFGVDAEGFETTVPGSGSFKKDGNDVRFTIDHRAGYLEFKLSDKFNTWQVGRAEYQDFNAWNDAHTDVNSQKFRADSIDTNCVNVAEMKTYPADMSTWKAFVANDNDWNETFYLTDYDTKPGDRFEKEVFQVIHETPNPAWNAQNITFVSERFATVKRQSTESGLAGKLQGSGRGMLEFTSALAPSMPEGIEKITLNGRIGQSYTFDDVSYDKGAYMDDGYTFFVPMTMSHRTKTNDAEPGDMAVGASVSLVGYYDPDDLGGFYEFRVSRLYLAQDGSGAVDTKRKTVRLALYKWVDEGFQWVPKMLCSKDFTSDDLTAANAFDLGPWSDENPSTNERDRKFAGFFLSLETDYVDDDPLQPKSTRIVCGLSSQNAIKAENINKPWNPYNAATNASGQVISSAGKAKWVGLTYEDKTNPIGWGSYGVMAKDCPAQFVMPAHIERPFNGMIKEEKQIEGQAGKYFEKEDLRLGNDEEFVDDRRMVQNARRWATRAGRCEPFVNAASGYYSWIGLRTPTNLVQDLVLYLKPKGTAEDQWRAVATNQVVGYGFQALPGYTLKRPSEWDVRLRTGSEKAVDVVVDAVRQYRWQAPDINDPGKITSDDRSGIFVFSQSVVETNKDGSAYLVMQPARALDTRPVSLRGPIMKGVGKLTFDYRNADANAEIWVQVATNATSGGLVLTGAGGYNDSLESVELGEPAPLGTWTTVAKYSAKASGDLKLAQQEGVDSKTVYLGWHDHPGKPIRGLYRLVVPVKTVQNAVRAAQAGNDDYGRITITACSCTDEPGMSERSWYAWNMRTVGDSKDSEGRMNLVDMVIEGGGQGLVCALNNSTIEVEDNKKNPIRSDDKKLCSQAPFVCSPTMASDGKSGIGSVSVKARLYGSSRTTENGGLLVIWGATDSRATVWTPLATNVITSSVFSNFTWKAGHDVYTAIKFEVSDPSARTPKAEFDRIVIDEIVIGEKVPPTINFVYARPFRMNLFATEEIADILSPNEQPLMGESWGVQTHLTLQQLTDEIDVEKGFEVRLSYFRGTEPWGYDSWKDLKGAVTDIPLVQVGDASNLVFRSVGDRPESLVEPAQERGEVVQFMLKVKYWDRGGKSDEVALPSDWQQPDWFYPLDYNKKNGNKFAAYTVLDTVSPGRAWINEVSWNDGPAEENGSRSAPVERQYFELCVPIGIDLTDWYVQVRNQEAKEPQIIAKLGDVVGGIPASKSATPNATNGYEFLVVQSPATAKAGGIIDPKTGKSAADATWYDVNLSSSCRDSSLYYGEPYQFELVRPSGIIEHQFVMGGTNDLLVLGDWAHIYDATNMVAEMNAKDLTEFPFVQSPKRLYALDDVSRTADGDYASTGVVKGEDSADTANWPGGSNTWKSAMHFTPGRLNEGQTIPKGWFLPPNGTNSWVYLIAEGEHVRQDFGGDTSRSILIVVPQGRTTNVTYSVDNWFELVVTENDVPVVTGRTGTYTHTVTPTNTACYVVARDVPQHELEDVFGLGPDNPYSSAVRRWLVDQYGEYGAEDIRLARFKGLNNLDAEDWLSLTDMYWLDIPPVPLNEDEWAMNDGTNWWLRGGITKMGTDHVIHRTVRGPGGTYDVTYTNKQVDVTLYMSNACPTAAIAPHAPQHLQGLDYESSDSYSGVWTSVTFKVCGKLELSKSEEFLPFRIFTFDGESFTGPEAPKPFTATIDILDPFKSPIGRNYDWDKYPNTKAYFIWRLNGDYYPYTTERLKADSTYPDYE